MHIMMISIMWSTNLRALSHIPTADNMYFFHPQFHYPVLPVFICILNRNFHLWLISVAIIVSDTG